MDLLIVNLKLLGAHAHDISKLPEYCRLVADAVGVPIAVNYPVMGEDAFRTGTGVHAAAIIKAKDRKSTRLNSSHGYISYAVFCLKKKKKNINMFCKDISTILHYHV